MHYIWFIWSLVLIALWLAIYFLLDSRDKKREMFVVSILTAFTGLSEPLFVPMYWNPPSLFDLALRTGFDIESVIFSFGTGGIAVVLYEWVVRTRHAPMTERERHSAHHRFHFWTILSAPAVFVILFTATNMNPIYSVIIALSAGGLATWYCRPDLKKKMITSGFLFLGLYFFYFWTLIALSPGYVEKVWNIAAISGILILGVPLEELLFAFSFGFMWSSVYEHFTWRKLK